MPRPLRAQRYAEGASPSLIWMITERLPYLSFPEAMEFYRDWVPRLKPNERALLGCNDRYFLMTGMLNRSDALPPKVTLKAASWLYDRVREVEAEPDGYIDLWARFSWKSSAITNAGVIQEILTDPELTVGIFSITKDISEKFLKQIKEELETNEELKATYADVLWENPRQEASTWSLKGGITVKRIGNPKESSVEAHGLIDALPTGRHFGLLVYDDAINEKNVTNPEQIKKATDRIQLSFNLGVGEATRKWFIGTRYSYADSYAWLLDPLNQIAIPRLYPATDDGTLDGTPVFLSQEAWDKIKREQRDTVAAQFLQNPLSGKEQTFLTKWLKPYWVRPNMLNVYIMGDPSKGKSKTSDRTAIAVVGIDVNANKYLLDGYCHRMPLSERWDRLKELHKKWVNMPGVQLVKVGWERYGLQTDEEYFDERMLKDGPRFEIIELNWTGDAGGESKNKRIARLEPDFRHGEFFVPGKVWHTFVDDNGHVKHGEARWFLQTEDVKDEAGNIIIRADDNIHYRINPGPHAEERRCKQNGEHWRLFDPIRRLDEDKNIYDLTRVFFQEWALHPFAPRDDLIDSISRVYDMDPMPATRLEVVHVEDYIDA